MTAPATDPARRLSYWREAVAHTASSWRDAATSRIPGNVAAGITVALVALPLNMALALACGLPASVGLVTGAIAGLLGALLGGSRLQITGPEVALAPISFEIVSRHGFEGLLVVTMLAGVLQIALGLLRVGRLIHSIPVPVLGGFLAAVGIMVFDSQVPVLLGISEDARLVTEITPSLLARISWPTVSVGLVVIAFMVLVPRLDKRAPAPLIGLVVAMALVAALGVPSPMVDPIEGGFPGPRLPSAGGIPFAELAAEAVALALIASIDSLLCAVSIDARTTGPRTRTDQELVAQGLANMGSACFGGMPVAAAVVRSAAAVEAGATTRLAPLTQSVLLAMVLVVFAPFVRHVPMVALASILLVIGWRLIDWRLLRHMWRSARFEVAVFAATAAGILLTDFVLGVLIGVLVALADFAHAQRELVKTRRAVWRSEESGVQILRLEGPLFFASQAKIDLMLEDVHEKGPLVIDLSAVPTLDSSGASALARGLDRILRSGDDVWITALSDQARTLLEPTLARPSERLHFAKDLEVALAAIARQDEVDPGAAAARRRKADSWRRLPASIALDRR